METEVITAEAFVEQGFKSKIAFGKCIVLEDNGETASMVLDITIRPSPDMLIGADMKYHLTYNTGFGHIRDERYASAATVHPLTVIWLTSPTYEKKAEAWAKQFEPID